MPFCIKVMLKYKVLSKRERGVIKKKVAGRNFSIESRDQEYRIGMSMIICCQVCVWTARIKGNDGKYTWTSGRLTFSVLNSFGVTLRHF